MVFRTITFEELPPHLEHPSVQALRPSSIEEDEDDPRSLLYLFEDNDFERAAAFLAIEEARHQAQARAEALAEAEAYQRRILQQERTQALAARLEQLLDEDDDLVDLLGRRILATNGYQVPDLWQPHHYHHHHHRYGPRFHHYTPYHTYGSQHASTSREPHDATRLARFPDVHAAWDGYAEEADLSDYARASPFIHTAPLIFQADARRPPKVAQGMPVRSVPGSSQSSAPRAPTPTHARIAIHPLTGVPMLLVEEESGDAITGDAYKYGDAKSEVPDAELDTDDEADEWDIDDESDLDWLGLELLRRQGGANVWILGTGDGNALGAHVQPRTELGQAESSKTPNLASALASGASEQAEPTTAWMPTLPVEVEEVDSDHELANVASALDPSRNEAPATLSSPSQRVAAALANAALLNPAATASTASKAGSGAAQPRRQRAATVMSESEEEELETVGRPVVETDAQAKKDDANRLDDRPRKTVKVTDLR